MAALAKIYGSEHKYSGKNDSFDYKFKIFISYCQKAGILQEHLPSAFTLMLKDKVLNFYFTN